MARPSPSCAHDDDRLRLPPASPSRSNSAEKKESTVRRLSQLCPPCATPSSNSSLDYRRSDARIVKNGFAASSGVSKSAKVVTLLWQILSGTGFPNQFFCDSWVVGFWRGRPWLAGRRIGKKSLDAFSSRFWLGWVTKRGEKCVHSTCRG